MPVLIRILLRADHPAVIVAVAAIVAVVAVGADSSSCPYCRGTIAPTSAVTGITCDRTARTTCDGATCYRMRGVWTARNAIAAAMKPSRAAVHASSTHAAVESAAATEAATSATASIGVIRYQACGEQNGCGESSENEAKHDCNLPGISACLGKCDVRFAGS
jgi:hypothetical protein